MGNASVQRGLFLTFRGFPSSVRAFGPATFPVGEGDLRRGSVHRGLALTFRGPLHTRPGLCPVHPLQAGEGGNPSSVTPYGVPPSPWGKAASGGGCIHGARSLSVGVPFASKLVPPLIRRCGGTFPQGKVRKPAGAVFLWFTPGSGIHWDSTR